LTINISKGLFKITFLFLKINCNFIFLFEL
jgi:hypothetical protein